MEAEFSVLKDAVLLPILALVLAGWWLSGARNFPRRVPGPGPELFRARYEREQAWTSTGNINRISYDEIDQEPSNPDLMKGIVMDDQGAVPQNDGY